jgi:hypothetical protein
MTVLARVNNSVTEQPKKKPRIGSIRDLHLAKLGGGQALKRLTAVSECSSKLRQNLLLKPALTDILGISCVSTIDCSKAAESVWYP